MDVVAMPAAIISGHKMQNKPRAFRKVEELPRLSTSSLPNLGQRKPVDLLTTELLLRCCFCAWSCCNM
eukprot:2744815-Amphidinium_carterae.2